MILQALKEYYDRKAADPESEIAPEGWERKEIPFVVVIKGDGSFVSLEDTREKKGKKFIGKVFLVPRSKIRTGGKSYETTFLLWDHAGYLFGLAKTTEPSELEKATNQHRSWLRSLDALPDGLKQDKGVAAILEFYRTGETEKVKANPQWAECVKLPSCNMSFRLAGDELPVPCRGAVKTHVSSTLEIKVPNDSTDESADVIARCLVTGEIGSIARTHGRTSINKDTKSLVAFQTSSGYDSYGKEQCFNAPVSKPAEFAYTTALNTLLKSSDQRLLVGDAVTVFWTSRYSSFETEVSSFFSEPSVDDPDRGARAVAALLESVKSGAYAKTESDVRFYVLGLSPNSARIAVRFWQVGTVPEMASRFARHFEDIKIAHGPKDRDALSLFRLLLSTASLRKSENIAPNLAGDTMRSILEGRPYPATLLQAAVRRIRAEHEINHVRAALLKAIINRKSRYENPKIQEEIKVSLDCGNTNIGYRLGRLFAALEKIQADAQGNPNATIRDRFYGAASGTPATVFGTLMRLKNHHLSKLSDGHRIVREKLIGEIMDGISDFPHHLKLEDQGRFAIGYYHQMQDFFTKKEKQD